MEIYQIAVLFICGIVFGLVAKSLTRDEREIYRRKQYFPLFKITLAIASVVFYFVKDDIAFVLASILIMITVWDFEFRRARKK